MNHVDAYVLTSGERGFLRGTLESLLALPVSPEWETRLTLIANPVGPDTLKVIEEFRPRLHAVVMHPQNLWMGGGFDEGMPPILTPGYVILSEDDVRHQLPLYEYARILLDDPKLGAVSGQMSPEHQYFDHKVVDGRVLHYKWMERGQCMAFRAEDLQAMRPFPRGGLPMVSLDTWVFSGCPKSCQKTERPIAVVPGGVIHTGCVASTWQGSTPEYSIEFLDAISKPGN
jgi:hypothetical protein